MFLFLKFNEIFLLLCGFIELKRPGTGADPNKFKAQHDREQWLKLRLLPNLIYTDGSEWALYRTGKPVDVHGIFNLNLEEHANGKVIDAEENLKPLSSMLMDLFNWEPYVPAEPSDLAKLLAPISRLLRSEVEHSLRKVNESAISSLANDWRKFFFPDADNLQFADAYTQTVTYALLLARLAGATSLEPRSAAQALDKNNGLLARTLDILAQDAQSEIPVGYSLLRRALEALDPNVISKTRPDLWVYFYEEFLKEYSPQTRRDFGVYYTPKEIVCSQIRLVSLLLEKKFGKKLGFADKNVKFIDPATGTGTYLVEAVEHGLDKVGRNLGPGTKPACAVQIANNMHGFEILVGPYAVAKLRLTQTIEDAINSGKSDPEKFEKFENKLKIFLADTLESPESELIGSLNLPTYYRIMTNENEAARRLKNEGTILVCIGNPPYNRQEIDLNDRESRRNGGWVRFGDPGRSQEDPKYAKPILEDFKATESSKDAGVHYKNLYNDYVYFWRWDLWRLFEQQDSGGIVSFITPSSYLSGPGFVGMREFMRRSLDEIWILDLGGTNRGTRKSANVFNIQTPVAIAIGVRGVKKTPNTPAKIHYARIEADNRDEKLKKLDNILTPTTRPSATFMRSSITYSQL